MALERLARWAVPGAVLMGGAWCAAGIVVWAVPDDGEGPGTSGEIRYYLVEGLHAVGEIGLLAALVGLFVYQHLVTGRLGSVGFWTAFLGTLSMFVATLLAMTGMALRGEFHVVDGVLFGSGLVGWLVGFSLLGIATLRTEVFPGWVGWLLIAFVPLAVFLHLVLFAYGVGGVAVGLIWFTIGYALWMHERASTGVNVDEAGVAGASGE